MFSLFCWGTDLDLQKDEEFLKHVEKRIEFINKQVDSKGFSLAISEELNSYGYPLKLMQRKYMNKQDMYKRISQIYERILYIKRKLFPYVIKEEAKRLGIYLCDVQAEGSRKERIVLRVNNPSDEETALKILTQTQLQFAYLLNIEEIKFEKCQKTRR